MRHDFASHSRHHEQATMISEYASRFWRGYFLTMTALVVSSLGYWIFLQ